MSELDNTRILLGVTGGIAAYKSAELTRLLTKAGADVRVVMTAGAMEFITPLTLQAVSGNPVHHALLDTEAEAGMGHIELAKWADLILIAPATADVIARLSAGLANDLLTTLCLASANPLIIAPAMNQQMWRNEITQDNVTRLQALLGNRLTLIGPAAGEQACGDTGPGRLVESSELVAQLVQHQQRLSQPETDLNGLSVVITAGPTREALDPVRYISNHSSGKMGVALAEAAQRCGADVTLICGPVSIPMPDQVRILPVNSAEEMLEASLNTLTTCDVFIAAAAVADYRPLTQSSEKIKKSGDTIELTLVKNPDIVATVAHHKNRPFTVGFAAETQDLERYALGKLTRKNLDMVIANDVSQAGIGFNSANNAVTVFWQQESGQPGQRDYPEMPKHLLADALIQHIHTRYQHQTGE